MNSQQRQLYDQLLGEEPTPAAKAILKRTSGQFVLDYGWWYKPAPLPESITLGTPQQCHKNALDLATEYEGLIYCEGLALSTDSGHRIIHAWVTDGEGRAFDNTWQTPGVAYAGVPFKTLFVTMTMLKNRAMISLLDDWQNRYPLRGDLGDRPDEWYEKAGEGLARVTH